MVALTDYSGLSPAWCPGCGNYGILKALNEALTGLALEPAQVLLVSGIGQAGKLPHYTRGNVFNGLHGRALPAAIGARITNPDLKVIVIGGDGDGYGEGGNHFIHSMRRNHDLTYLVHDNQVYGLTKGQTSPTSDQGFVTKTTPQGAGQPELPLALAIAAGASFVARGFAGDVEHLAGLIKMGITHKGFALIDILQPCVTFNHKNTYGWYKERIYDLGTDAGYDRGNKLLAFEKAHEWDNRIPVGIIYQQEKPAFEDGLLSPDRGSLVSQPIEPGTVEKLLGEFI
jgi:2-oxoglutarate ferredoxin oxidoreductase subunit beta